MNVTDDPFKDYEDLKIVLCHRCPWVGHCPVEHRDALKYLQEREGTQMDMSLTLQVEAYLEALETAKKGAEACPGVILIRESKL